MNLLKSRLLKPLATLLSGSVLAQGITLVSYLILTRIYTPDDFGAFNIFYSYIEILIILSTCKYELAPVISDSDREASAVSRFALRLNATVSIAILVIAVILNLFHCLPGKLDSIGWVTVLIPFMVFFCGTTRVYAALFNRFKKFSQIVWSDTSISAGGALFKIGLGLTRLFHIIGLPLGTVLGQAAGNINYLVNLNKLQLPKDISREERRSAARKFCKFPLFTAPKDFVDTLSGNLPFIWLAVAIAVPDSEIGLFGLALTFTYRPVNVFNIAAERVLYVDIDSRLREKKMLGSSVAKFLLTLNLLAIPIFIVLYLFAEPLFSFVFGAKWAGSAPYFHALLPWMWILLSTNSLLAIPYALSKQQGEFVFSLILLVLRVTALSVGIVNNNFLLAIRLYAAVSAVVAFLRIAWYAILIHHHDKGLR
ncbi:MAG: oligosaccharide flippase family protein [Bacteroidales bacterium]|nr:oligosaccharide flippase family protein [Bacteroidales bacterium]